jgi:hypothetical protein
MVLATWDGAEPDARTVVLRGADKERGELLFYSDARAHKVAQTKEHPSACLVAWSRALQWQLKLRVDLDVEMHARDAGSRWAQLRMAPASSDFLSDLSTPYQQLPLEPSRAPLEHFAIIIAKVKRMEWLELNANRHRAAVLSALDSHWVDP